MLMNLLNHTCTTNAMRRLILITLITCSALVFIRIQCSLCTPCLISLTDMSNHFLTQAVINALYLFPLLTYSISGSRAKIRHLSFLRYDRKCAGVHRINLVCSIFPTEASTLLLLPTKCTVGYFFIKEKKKKTIAVKLCQLTWSPANQPGFQEPESLT